MLRPNANRGGFVFSRQQPCQGLSFVELIGCLTAIAGGLLLGALYMGVDVKTTTIALLKQSELIEPQWLEVEPEGAGSQADGSDASVPSEQSVAGTAPNTGGADLDPEVAAHADASQSSEAMETSPTQQFWRQLLQIMQQESKGRQENDKGQLFEYLTERQQRHQEAAEAIASLGQPRGVDGKVLAYAVHALQWHESGGKLYHQAAQMLTFAPSSKWSGPFAQSWQSAATQHRMEEKLLLAKQNAISSYLDSPSFSDR